MLAAAPATGPAAATGAWKPCHGASTPCAWIECRPHSMASLVRIPRQFAALVPGAACCSSHSAAAQSSIPLRIWSRQAACSSRNAAPAIRSATRTPRAPSGRTSMTRSASTGPTTSAAHDIRGLVDYWIQYPNVQGAMPAKLVNGQAAQDVAGYVAAWPPSPGRTPARSAIGRPAGPADGRQGAERHAADRCRPDRAAEVHGLERDGDARDR